jgi:hypothetical protein
VRRRERAGRALSDAELLDAYDEWRRSHPRPPVSESDEASLQAWQAWRDQYKAWMDEQGTSFDELDRLQHRRTTGNLRWVAVEEGREWGGVDVPVWAPSPPDITLWRCPSCSRTTIPHDGHASLCVVCLRAQAGYGYVDEQWGNRGGNG